MKRQVASQRGVWRSFGSAVSGTGAKIASGLAAIGVARWLKGSLEVARQAEVTTAKLKSAVTATGASWAGYEGKLAGVLTQTSAVSAYSSGQLKGALAALTQTTGNADEAMSLLSLTTDLARGKNMDLSKAALLVGKVAKGNTSALSRYGIKIDSSASSTEALALLQQRFAGQAKAYGETAAGSSDKFNNALRKLQATVGTAILPSVTALMGKLVGVLEVFQSLPGGVQKVIIGLAAFAGAGLIIAPFVSSVIGAVKAMQLATVATKLWAAAQWLWNAAMTANPIGIVIVALIALGVAIVIAWKKSETFRRIVTGAWEAIKRATLAVFGAIVAFLRAWGPRVLSVLANPLGALVSLFVRNWSRIREGASAAFGAVVSVARGLPGKIKAAVGNLARLLYSAGRDVVYGLRDGISAAWTAVTERIRSLISGLSKAAKKALGISSPSRVFAEIGRQSGAGLAVGLDASRALVAGAAAQLAGAATGGALGEPAFAGLGAGSSSRSIVISAGAVHVEINGSGGDPLAIEASARAGIEPALTQLAREIRRL